jgi:hypothetical protein
MASNNVNKKLPNQNYLKNDSQSYKPENGVAVGLPISGLIR